jgi:hypothetical protein
MDKTYKMKIKKGIMCSIISFILGGIMFLLITMFMYLNAAAQLNIGTRQKIHTCSGENEVKIEQISSFFEDYTVLRDKYQNNTLFGKEEHDYQSYDKDLYCFCEKFRIMEVIQGSDQLLKKYCQFFKFSKLIKNIMMYTLPLLILLSNSFYRYLIQTLIRIFPFKEKSKEIFIQTFLYLFVGFNEIVSHLT